MKSATKIEFKDENLKKKIASYLNLYKNIHKMSLSAGDIKKYLEELPDINNIK